MIGYSSQILHRNEKVPRLHTSSSLELRKLCCLHSYRLELLHTKLLNTKLFPLGSEMIPKLKLIEFTNFILYNQDIKDRGGKRF